MTGMRWDKHDRCWVVVIDGQATGSYPNKEAAERARIDEAKAAIKRGVMARYIDLPIASIEVGDADAIRYIEGATIEELLA